MKITNFGLHQIRSLTCFLFSFPAVIVPVQGPRCSMAATQQLSLCGKMRILIRNMTEAVCNGDNLQSPHSSLYTRLSLMRTYHQDLKTASRSARRWTATAPACMHPERVPLLTDLSALLTVLGPQLDSLGLRLTSASAHIIGTAEEELF